MKTTLMTIALGFATLPLTFAAQAPATPAAGSSQTNPPAATSKVKKHSKKHAMKPAKKNIGSSSTSSTAPTTAPVKK